MTPDTAPAARIRVLLVDDHTVVRRGLRLVFELEDDLEIVGEAADGREALAQVKTLKGMLPICASCKKSRDDQGYWHQVDVYLRDHSEAELSHGICPDCHDRLYPQYAKRR